MDDRSRGEKPSRRDLPVLGQSRVERADAARNRQRILDAAERLIALHGVANLSIEKVASEAGVGIGTVYRRFGDREGLAYALLDEREREFQHRFMRGPPPFGPGASPRERIEAFLHAYVDHLEELTDLLLAAESATGSRYRSGAYSLNYAHLTQLLRQAIPRTDVADVEYIADAIFAPLSAELYAYQRNRGVEPERIKGGLSWMVRRLVGGAGSA
jgi:AcrR family transcriptional regulator